MLKLVLSGLWVAAVTAAAAYFSEGLVAGRNAAPQAGSEAASLEQLSTEMTSVPMVRDGAVLGYVIIQLDFAVDKALKEKLKVEPQAFLVDAAFRAVYQNPQADFARLRASDIDHLTEAIKDEANRRLGTGLVRQVLIQQLNYVRKEDIRTHWIKEN